MATNFVGLFGGSAFDVAVTPTVTAGAYTAGDIMGALMTFALSAIPNNHIALTGIIVTCQSNVTPDLQLMLFNADPTNTTKTDNAAYALNAADIPNLVAAIDLSTETWVDHGTVHSIQKDGLSIIAQVETDDVNLYGLLVDNTGVTLGGTDDIKVRLRGMRS